MKQSLMNRCLAISIVVLLLLVATGPRIFAQGNPNAVTNKEMKELLKTSGKLVSEAKSTSSSGDLNLTGYRVEEIQLPRSMTVQLKGQQAVVNKAWRVTVT